MEKLRISLPIIVEGRYDKSTLSSFVSAKIITTDGFSVFNSKEKRALIKKLAEKEGIIIITDSDAGGRQIRSFLSGFVPNDKIHHLYIPQILGKEKRKKSASKEGYLGVEGMERETLEKLLKPFTTSTPCEENEINSNKRMLTKLDLFADGLSGGEGASYLRAELAARLGLPRDMSAKALVDAINLLYSYEEYKSTLSNIKNAAK